MNTPYTFPVDAVLMVGPTGVGKSPLGDSLARLGLAGKRCHHLDFGAELRAIASGNAPHGVYAEKELAFIQGVLNRGLLLENEHFILAEKIIRLFLDRKGFASHHVLVLNGFPRHAGQAKDVASIVNIGAVISLECSVDVVFCRIKDNAGGDRTGRTDDNMHQVEKKLRIFRERTAPLLSHYANAGCRIYRICISATTTTEEAYGKLSILASAHPPVALVTEPPQR